MRPKPVRLVDAQGIAPSDTVRTHGTAISLARRVGLASVATVVLFATDAFGQKGSAPPMGGPTGGSGRMSAPSAPPSMASPRVSAPPRMSAPSAPPVAAPRVSAPPPRSQPSPPPPKAVSPPRSSPPVVTAPPPSGRIDRGSRATRPPTVSMPDPPVVAPRGKAPVAPRTSGRTSGPNVGTPPAKPAPTPNAGGRIDPRPVTPPPTTTTTTRTRTFDGGRPLPKPSDLGAPTKPKPDISVAGRTPRPVDPTARTGGAGSLTRTGLSPRAADPTAKPPRSTLPPIPPLSGGDPVKGGADPVKRDLPDLSTGRGNAPPVPPRDPRPDGNSAGDGDTIIVNGDVFVNQGTINYGGAWCGSGWWYPPACGWSPSWNWCGSPWWNSCGGWGGGWSLGFAFGSGGFGFSLGYSSGWGGCAWPGPWYGCGPAWGGWYGWNGGCGPQFGPWWGASISLVNCGWYPSIPCWNPCGPWWGGYAYSPYVAWAPYATVVAVTVPVEPATVVTVVEPPPVVAPVTPLAPLAPMGAVESEAWALLSEGFPETAAGLFASLHDDRPADARPLAGYAIALANLGDAAGAAATLRRALAIDTSVLGGLPVSPELAGRLQSLESAARVTTRQATATADSFFLLACWRTMLGRPTEAHLAATLAVERGDGSAGTARFRDWLANAG